MTLLARELRLRVDRVFATVRRAAPGPMLARLVVVLLAGAALALALPAAMTVGPAAPVLLVVALLPGLAPRSWLVTAVIISAGVAWVPTCLLYPDEVSVLRLVALSVVLYLLHATAALAAVLPYDAVVRAAVFVPWAVRALIVAVGSAGLGVFALHGTALLGEQSYLAASILGVAVVGALVWFLARLR